MKPRRGGQFSLLDMDREQLLALGRQGLRFRDIGEELNIAGSTAHVYWKRWASDVDQRARIVAIATRETLRLETPADDERLPQQIGPDFTDCAFLDDPRAANALDRLGRLNRPEPFWLLALWRDVPVSQKFINVWGARGIVAINAQDVERIEETDDGPNAVTRDGERYRIERSWDDDEEFRTRELIPNHSGPAELISVNLDPDGATSVYRERIIAWWIGWDSAHPATVNGRSRSSDYALILIPLSDGTFEVVGDHEFGAMQTIEAAESALKERRQQRLEKRKSAS